MGKCFSGKPEKYSGKPEKLPREVIFHNNLSQL